MDYKKLIKQGKIKLIKGRTTEALEIAMQAMQENPNPADAYILAGKAEFELINYRQAYVWLEEAKLHGKLDRDATKIYEISSRFVEENKRKESRRLLKERYLQGEEKLEQDRCSCEFCEIVHCYEPCESMNFCGCGCGCCGG